MSLSTTKRPAPQKTSQPPAGDLEQFSEKATGYYGYIRDSAFMAGMGVVGYGAAPLLGAGQTVSWAIFGGCTTFAAVSFASGRISSQRAQLTDTCQDALQAIMGQGLISIRMSAWGGPFSTTPGKITLRYSPKQNDSDPQWAKAIATTLAARTGLAFKVTSIDRKKCRLHLEISTEPDEKKSAQVLRTEALITDLVPTATVTNIEINELGDPVKIEIRHNSAAKLAARGYQNRVSRTISASMPGRWRARWNTQNDTAVFETRPELPPMMWVQPVQIDQNVDPLRSYRKVRIPYGMDEDGNTMVWAPAVDPHFMCVGATGSGKTSTEHNILETVSQYNWPIWIADAKGIEFLGFRSWPNVQVVATNVREQMAVIHRAWQVMDERYNLIIKGLASEEHFEPLMVFIDEWADMRVAIAQEYAKVREKSDPRQCPIFEMFESIARKGRTSRVHLLVSLQRPDVDLFGKGESRDNFRCRVSMGRLSPQGAQMMWGDPSVGVALPTGKPGRGITLNPNNEIVEILCFRAPDPRKAASDPEQMALLKKLEPTKRLHQPLRIEEPIVDDLDQEIDAPPPEPKFIDIITANWTEAEIRSWEEQAAEFTEEEAARARELATPATIIGVGASHSGRRNGPITTSHISDRLAEDDHDTLVESPIEPEFDGYAPPLLLSAGSVELGDLVLVDPDLGHWAVVDGEPDGEFSDDGCVDIPWRDDFDEEGLLTMPTTETITVRRTLEGNQ